MKSYFLLFVFLVVHLQLVNAQPALEPFYDEDFPSNPLVEAIEKKAFQSVKQMVENGADMYQEGGRQSLTPLEAAIQTDQLEVVKLLVANGIKDAGNYGMRMAVRQKRRAIVEHLIQHNFKIGKAIIDACEIDDLHLVKLLVKAGADVNITERTSVLLVFKVRRYSPIKMAINNDNVAICLYLIANGVAAEAAIEYGLKISKTGLLKSIINGADGLDLEKTMFCSLLEKNLEIVKYCIWKGADKNAANNEGKNLLLMAVANEDIEAVKFCIEDLQMDIKAATSYQQENALMLATQTNNLNLVDYVVAQGVDVNALNQQGENALFYTLTKSSNKNIIFDHLLAYGINYQQLNNNKSSLLLAAAQKGDLYAVSVLLKKQLSLSQANDLGETPLSYLYNHLPQSPQLLSQILDAGFDINSSSPQTGKNLLCSAIEQNDTTFIDFLLRKGADVNQDCSGKTPLDYATEQRQDNDVLQKLLRQYGAINQAEKLERQKALQQKIEHLLKQAKNTQNLSPVSEFMTANKAQIFEEKQVEEIIRMATITGNLSVLDQAIAYFQFDINHPINVNNQSLLILATIHKHITVINYLIDHDANLLHQDYYGKKAINYAKGRKIKDLFK